MHSHCKLNVTRATSDSAILVHNVDLETCNAWVVNLGLVHMILAFSSNYFPGVGFSSYKCCFSSLIYRIGRTIIPNIIRLFSKPFLIKFATRFLAEEDWPKIGLACTIAALLIALFSPRKCYEASPERAQSVTLSKAPVKRSKLFYPTTHNICLSFVACCSLRQWSNASNIVQLYNLLWIFRL